MGGGLASRQRVIAKGRRALLSWRVALLPFLEEEGLYRQFKLNEPWDSPHNKRLLAKMPRVFAPPAGVAAEPGTTYYQVFVGEHAAFEKHRALGVQDFPDGLSYTLLIAEAGSAVPWTKPEDLPYAADDPLPRLGGLFRDVFNVAFADGTARSLSKDAPPELLRRAITRDGGEALDPDRLRAPSSQGAAALRRQNARLRQQLERLREELEALRTEKEVLREEDAESAHLRQEQAHLERELLQLRQQTQRLRDEVRKLRGG
jgi:hypothetical protein